VLTGLAKRTGGACHSRGDGVDIMEERDKSREKVKAEQIKAADTATVS